MATQRRGSKKSAKKSGKALSAKNHSMLAEEVPAQESPLGGVLAGNEVANEPDLGLTTVSGGKDVQFFSIERELDDRLNLLEKNRAEGFFMRGAKPLPVLRGFLVSYDKMNMGESFQLREGRWLVSSDLRVGENGTFLLRDDSVAKPHAVLRVGPGPKTEVIDHLSEGGTFIRRAGTEEEQKLDEVSSELRHGDILRFGQRTFRLCLLPNTPD